MLPFSVLFLVCIVLLVLYLIKENKPKPDNFPPGPPKLPLIGSYLHIQKECFGFPHKAFITLSNKYKTDVLGFFMGGFALVTCHSPKLVKEVLTRDEFSDRPDVPSVRNRGHGRLLGIFFAEGLFWKDQRWFSLRHLRDFGFGKRDDGMEHTVADEVRRLIDFCNSKPKPCDADICTKQGIVKMPDVIYGPGLNCVHHSISKKHFEDYRELREVARAATRFLQSIDTTGNLINFAPWLRYINADYFGWTSSFKDNKIVIDFARKVVAEHKESFSDDHLRDFIDIYLSEMNYLQEKDKCDTSFSDDQLVYAVSDYTFPAGVGIGHTLNFLFARLINLPQIQEKIQREIDLIVGTSRLPTLDDRKNMPYTEACIRESLRKDPIVPLSLGRRATVDTHLGGYFIPKGTLVLPNIWGMHNHEEWGDPENFRPERWLDSEGNLLRKDPSLPFGAGKRLCAGETFARNTMFLFVGGIMQHFSLRMPKGSKSPDPDNHKNGVTISIDSYYMEVVPRD